MHSSETKWVVLVTTQASVFGCTPNSCLIRRWRMLKSPKFNDRRWWGRWAQAYNCILETIQWHQVRASNCLKRNPTSQPTILSKICPTLPKFCGLCVHILVNVLISLFASVASPVGDRRCCIPVDVGILCECTMVNAQLVLREASTKRRADSRTPRSVFYGSVVPGYSKCFWWASQDTSPGIFFALYSSHSFDFRHAFDRLFCETLISASVFFGKGDPPLGWEHVPMYLLFGFYATFVWPGT